MYNSNRISVCYSKYVKASIVINLLGWVHSAILCSYNICTCKWYMYLQQKYGAWKFLGHISDPEDL